MTRNMLCVLAAGAALTLGAAGCGTTNSDQSAQDNTYTEETTAVPTTTERTSDAPPEVNQAVLDYGRNIYRRLAQGDPTFNGPSDVDAAYCNRAGDSAYGDPLYECYYTYDGGTEETPVKTWSWQGNAGAIPEDGDWSQ